MKLAMSLLFLIVCSLSSVKSQPYITTDLLSAVYLIKYGNKTGTCFLTLSDSSSYLVTAKHIFPYSFKSKSPVEIEILNKNGWIKINCTLLIHNNPEIDIAVLDLHKKDTSKMPFSVGLGNSAISQDCYFLGFPFGLKIDADYIPSVQHSGFPFPFVKKGITSAIYTDSSRVTRVYVDGHNNPGFSGGPVVTMDINGKNRYNIIGVVSAYLTDRKPIKTPFGEFINDENSGIVLAYGMNHVAEIILASK